MTLFQDIRRAVLTAVIFSFGTAALMGIAVLLGSDFGYTQGRILGTTLVICCASGGLLCMLTVVDHPWWGLGAAGAVAVAVATTASLVVLWSGVLWPNQHWWDAAVIGTVLSATAAQLCLLFSLVLRPGRTDGLKALLAATTALASLSAAMIISLVLVDTGIEVFTFIRVLGVLLILDVLGTLVLAGVCLFGTSAARGAVAVREVRLSLEQQKRLVDWAVAHRTSPERAIEEALETLEEIRAS